MDGIPYRFDGPSLPTPQCDSPWKVNGSRKFGVESGSLRGKMNASPKKSSFMAATSVAACTISLSFAALGCGGAANQSRGTLTTFNLSITIAGAGGGNVTSNPVGFNCTSNCSSNIPSGSTVTLLATAGANSRFMGWAGDCNGTADCIVELNSGKSVTATFGRIQYSLGVAVNGSGQGALHSMPAGLDCGHGETVCSSQFDAGTSVTLTPVIAQGSTFGGWSNECVGIGSCMVSMSAARNVAATFNLIRFAVVVSLDSSGSGLVQSQPQGIACGRTCFANFEGGQSVTLTAVPAAGFKFFGWTGDCTGTAQCTLAKIATAHSVVARFQPAGAP
jgi:hypothetical protein